VSSSEEFARWLGVVADLGGQIPEDIIKVLQSMTSFKEAIRSGGGYPVDYMMKALGKGVSPEQAFQLCTKIVTRNQVGTLGQHLPRLDFEAGAMIAKLLRGAAGDDLVDSLREGAQEAIAGIQEAGAHFSGEATPERVLELGGEAVEAWNRAKGYGAYLDRLINAAFRPIVGLEVLPPELLTDRGLALTGVWVVDPAKAHLLEEVGRLIISPTTSFSIPGERWLKINSLVGLRLNSPRQAIEILSQIRDEEQAELIGTRDLTYQDRDQRLDEQAGELVEPPGSVGYVEVS
jgi:hypothetical protein